MEGFTNTTSPGSHSNESENKKLLGTYIEGSKTYNNLKLYLESPVPLGMENLLSYLENNSGVISRFDKDLVKNLYNSFKDSPDEFVKNSVDYLNLLEKEGLSKIEEARKVEKESDLLSEEGKEARNFLMKAISGIDLEKNKNIPSFSKLIEEIVKLLLDKIKERYNWTQQIQDGYYIYLRTKNRLK